MHVVYILRCGDGTLYTGAAKDLARRLAQHAAGRASRYTRSRLPVTLLWSRRERSWGRALQTELFIKALPRKAKDELINGTTRLRVSRRSPPRRRRRA
jgi:putative endonuclease